MSIIPDKALEQHIAILGVTGSGKTFAAKGIVEGILAAKGHVCVIDPTGAWSGLRSSANGKRAGFPIVIFGGDHADVPLTASSGEAIAEIVATTDTSCVLDTGNMTVRDQTKFLTAFAETLYRLNRKPLHLVIDEAHNIMPQSKVADPQSAMMLHAANRLLSQGRSRGLRVMMISQRPQKLHKDSLSQAQALIAMRVVAPQDRRAIEDWIGAWADVKDGASLLTSLPSLDTGEGWVWAPVAGLLKRVTFPPIKTYDSSRAPDDDGDAIVLAKIDLPAIEERLASVAQEAAQNDPKHLRAQLAELQRAKGKPDADALRKAEEAGYARGRLDGMEEAGIALRVEVDGLAGISGRLGAMLADLTIGGNRQGAMPTTAARPFLPPKLVKLAPGGVELRAGSVKLAAERPKSPTEGVTNPQQRILDAMASLSALGITDLNKIQVAAIAGVSPNSGSYANNLGRLRTMRLIDYPKPGCVSLTGEGIKAAAYPDFPPTLADLHTAWLALVTGPQQRILSALIDTYPDAMPKSGLAEVIGVSPGSGSFANNLGRLRTLGVIEYPQQGYARADDVLFPAGVA